MNKRAFSLLFGIIVLLFTSIPAHAATVRQCAYIPGVSVPAQMPLGEINPPAPTPFPSATPPSPTKVDAKTTTRQLGVYQALWDAVNDHYVYTDFRGRDWKAIGASYKTLIQKGLSDDDFYALMEAMVNALGDDHSFFQSPATVKAETGALEKGQNYVGVGFLAAPLGDGTRATIISVFPNGPAAKAGLLPHDTLLNIDGGPIRDETGASRTRGPEGSQVTLTMQRPGEAPHDYTLTRSRVTGAIPIDYCIVPKSASEKSNQEGGEGG